jgi:hypothetical protein
MDIRKWLDETVQPEVPLEPIEHLQRTRKTKPAKQKRQRKRSKSDSSLLDPRSDPLQKPAANEPKPPTDGGTGQSASEARQTTPSDSSSNNRYARRPRRKTRPEHYEHSSKAITKEWGNYAHRRGEGESKKPRRKSRCKKSEKPGNSTVQNFQAKNVSSDRLTVREHAVAWKYTQYGTDDWCS